MKILRLLMCVFILIGVCSISYPTIATIIADYTSTKVIIDYEKQIAQMKQIEIEEQKEAARNYNNTLKNIDIMGVLKMNTNKSKDTTSPKKKTVSKLRDTKKVYKKGELLGYIEIQKIDAYLPLYEGTYESILLKGIGHLEGSSLPVGGKGTHSIFTGHSGMASATLFSRLEELNNNDIFIIHFLDEILAYKIDSIETVKPDEADKYIKIEKDKDYVTLITCTPKTINTHRLLVRGTRIPYNKEHEIGKVSDTIENHKTKLLRTFAILSLIFITAIVIIMLILRNRNRKSKYKNH